MFKFRSTRRLVLKVSFPPRVPPWIPRATPRTLEERVFRRRELPTIDLLWQQTYKKLIIDIWYRGYR